MRTKARSAKLRKKSGMRIEARSGVFSKIRRHRRSIFDVTG